MMRPPIFQVCSDDPQVTALLGSNPVRLYSFGRAPQNVQDPYVVWQMISGLPENYLGQLPDTDSYTVQVDVYSREPDDLEAVALALRDAIEPHADIVSWRGESQEDDTKYYRFSFDVDWFVGRVPV